MKQKTMNDEQSKNHSQRLPQQQDNQVDSNIPLPAICLKIRRQLLVANWDGEEEEDGPEVGVVSQERKEEDDEQQMLPHLTKGRQQRRNKKLKHLKSLDPNHYKTLIQR